MCTRSEAIDRMAESIPSYVDLDDAVQAALALIQAGFHGADIGNDFPAIVQRAKAMRNAITDIAMTVAQFQGA